LNGIGAFVISAAAVLKSEH